jgi:hypothetical protein
MHKRRKMHSLAHIYSMTELWQLKKFHNNNGMSAVTGGELQS